MTGQPRIFYTSSGSDIHLDKVTYSPKSTCSNSSLKCAKKLPRYSMITDLTYPDRTLCFAWSFLALHIIDLGHQKEIISRQKETISRQKSRPPASSHQEKKTGALTILIECALMFFFSCFQFGQNVSSNYTLIHTSR